MFYILLHTDYSSIFYLFYFMLFCFIFQRGKLDALALLLDHGADLEARTNTDGTALVWGCMGGDPRVVRHLLDRGADISSVTKVRNK